MVRLNRNSRTSSKLPSSDPNHKRGSRAQGERKAGGQEGRDGVTMREDTGVFWRADGDAGE